MPHALVLFLVLVLCHTPAPLLLDALLLFRLWLQLPGEVSQVSHGHLNGRGIVPAVSLGYLPLLVHLYAPTLSQASERRNHGIGHLVRLVVL